MRLAAHPLETHVGFPETSNFECLPGIAGGSPIRTSVPNWWLAYTLLIVTPGFSLCFHARIVHALVIQDTRPRHCNKISYLL
jgi:hypothetical protein